MVAGELLAGHHDERLAADGGAVRGLDQGGGHPLALGVGSDAEAAQREAVGDGVEDEAPGRSAVERGQQPAAPAQQPGDRVEVVGEGVRRRVERGPGTEGLPDDRQHVGGRLGPDPAYVEGHGPPSPSASEIRSSSSAVTCLWRSRITM